MFLGDRVESEVIKKAAPQGAPVPWVTMRYRVVPCGTVWYRVVRCGTVWYTVVLCGTAPSCIIVSSKEQMDLKGGSEA